MTRALELALALSLASAMGCHSDPNTSARRAAMPEQVRISEYEQRRDNQANFFESTPDVDPEQREYARASRERLRAIQVRAEEIKQKRQAIPPGSQGDMAATLNLLPRKCDETEREIDALETITSEKWQQRKHTVDRKLANLEKSLDRPEYR